MRRSLDQIKEIQKQFDLSHKVGSKQFYVKIDEKNIHELEHLAVCLAGEFGEFCNILKKTCRGDITLAEAKPSLSEELADTFIYLIKISNQFGIDLESEFLKKIEKNKSRFHKD
jgi:NTP pyrophosphatase (non-canonical NTP hydrolase)